MDARHTAKRVGRALRHGVAALRNPRLPSNARVRLNVLTHQTLRAPHPPLRANVALQLSLRLVRLVAHGRVDRPGARRGGELRDELPRLRTSSSSSPGESRSSARTCSSSPTSSARAASCSTATSGLALEQHAAAIVERFAAVTISLDGHTRELYKRIRGVDGLLAVERGVRRIKALRPGLPVRARSTLQKQNFRALPELIDKAEAMGLDQISFLAADVTSESFGRKVVGELPDRRPVAR